MELESNSINTIHHQCQIVNISKAANINIDPPGPKLMVGDIVQILSMEEIMLTLDEHRETEHVWFMPWMAKFCGMKVEVAKRVNFIFDERAWKMLKCKNLVILGQLACNGNDLYRRSGCDRNCLYFWKEKWLKKIE
jgi:hypothetical protein